MYVAFVQLPFQFSSKIIHALKRQHAIFYKHLMAMKDNMQFFINI